MGNFYRCSLDLTLRPETPELPAWGPSSAWCEEAHRQGQSMLGQGHTGGGKAEAGL